MDGLFLGSICFQNVSWRFPHNIISGSVYVESIILIHVACQLGIKEPSHISLSLFPGFITKPWGVTRRFLMNLVIQHGRRRRFLSSLFIVFVVFSMFLSIEEWLPYLRKSRKFLCEDEALILLGHPTSNSLVKSLIIFSLHFYSIRSLIVCFVSMYSPV